MSLPLPKPKDVTTLLDVLRQSKLHDQQVEGNEYANQLANYMAQIKQSEAQYAPQTSQENLRKLQLANMISQAEADVAPQMQGTKLQQLQAALQGSNLYNQNMQMKNQFLPQEKEANLQRIMAELNLRQRQAQMPQMNKSASPLAKLNQDINLAKQGINPVTGQSLDEEEQKRMLQSLQSQSDKTTIPSDVQRFLVQADSIEKTMLGVDFDRISKFFGANGTRLRALGEKDLVSGISNPDYEQFVTFKEQIAPAVAKQMRQALQDSVQKSAAESYEKMINPRSFVTNPEFALKQFDSLLDLFEREKEARLSVVPSGSRYHESNKEFKNKRKEINEKREHSKLESEVFNLIRGNR